VNVVGWVQFLYNLLLYYQITQRVTSALARVLQVEPSEIVPNNRISSYGVDSLMSSELRSVLHHELHIDVAMVYLFSLHPTPSLLQYTLLPPHTPMYGYIIKCVNDFNVYICFNKHLCLHWQINAWHNLSMN
jgi:acyl carrier protein